MTENKSFEEIIEEKIIAKGLPHPRVTKEYIDALFARIEFVFGKVAENRIMCSADLDGFSIADGFGACVDPRRFDEEIGKQIAYKNCRLKAYDELWRLEGYRLSRSLKEAGDVKTESVI